MRSTDPHQLKAGAVILWGTGGFGIATVTVINGFAADGAWVVPLVSLMATASIALMFTGFAFRGERQNRWGSMFVGLGLGMLTVCVLAAALYVLFFALEGQLDA